jgi:NAD(P)H-dependent FMN reductase
VDEGPFPDWLNYQTGFTLMTTKPRIGIIISTTRKSRFADRPAQWLLDLASQRADADFEIVDLRDYPMPFFEEDQSPAWAAPSHPAARAWGKKMAELDGYVIITAEYNHSMSGVLKNALDHAYVEYNRKPVTFVGYGGLGASRAVEQLRQVFAELQVASLKYTVHINTPELIGMMRDGKSFADFAHLTAAAEMMLDDLVWWSNTLVAGRQAKPAAALDTAKVLAAAGA